MPITSKLLLALALAVTAANAFPRARNLSGGILLPLGVVLFMAFFIQHLLGREVARYDREQEQGKKAGPR